MRLRTLLIVIIALALAAPVRAQGPEDKPDQAASLKGLKGVEVAVTVNGAGATGEQLSAGYTAGAVEILKEAGVKVVDSGNDATLAGNLQIRLNVAPRLVPTTDGPIMILLVSLDTTCVTRVKAPHLDKWVYGAIWSTGGIALVNHIQSPILAQGIAEQIGLFVVDFKAANGAAVDPAEREV